MARADVIVIVAISLLLFISLSVSELADETTFTCSVSKSGATFDNDSTSNRLNRWRWRGTNIGGHLVLEPWITPSLFYQFLGTYKTWGDDAPKHVAFDSYSFCEALGPEEANRQLRRHWAAWVTEDTIREIAATGVNTVRMPVGDWLFVPYQPYIDCFAGGIEELDRVIHLCKKYDLNVLLDVHALKGSQNSFDNSGRAVIEWNSATSFNHISTANWLGEYNTDTQETEFNVAGFNHGLDVVQRIIDRYKDEPTIVGIEPVNEPWYYTPIDKLKIFYAKVYNLVQSQTPHWVSIFHDAFHPVRYTWNDFLRGCDNFAFDTHSYQAWRDVTASITYSQVACAIGKDLRMSEDAGIPMIVGEWSLAADNCAMWLNGFQDQIPTYPKTKCDMVKCSDVPPYMGFGVQPGAPPDASLGTQDPYGSGGFSSPVFGYCPVGATFSDGEDRGMTAFARSQLQAFETTHAQFMWNFRTELEPRWSFLEAYRRGWLPSVMDDDTISRIEVCDSNWVYDTNTFYQYDNGDSNHNYSNSNENMNRQGNSDNSNNSSLLLQSSNRGNKSFASISSEYLSRFSSFSILLSVVTIASLCYTIFTYFIRIRSSHAYTPIPTNSESKTRDLSLDI